MTALLWVGFLVSSVLYWWVGKVYIAQPRWNHPMIFHSPGVAKLLVAFPQAAFIAVVVMGFVFTDQGSWFLGAVAATIILLASKPSGV